ncbi:MAG: hypothetical protein WCO44_10490 [Bacteroidota bacterium]
MRKKLIFILRISSLALLISLVTTGKAASQVHDTIERADTSFHYDQINVTILVEGLGAYNIDVIYTENALLYVHMEELFKLIGIPCFVGQKGDSLGGLIAPENKPYLLDYKRKLLIAGGKTIPSGVGLIKDMGALFMESSLFAEYFGLTLTFNYRALTIILKSSFELPVLKQQRLEKLRSSISKYQGEVQADTTIKRRYHLFKGGMADWLISSNQTWNSSVTNHFEAGLGAEFLFGEVNITASYYDRQKFDKHQLQTVWRWVDNDKKIIKQAQVGNIPLQSISFITSPVIGAVIRNAPTTVRKATGYYTIREHTEPNWTVELYINNIMMDYTKADASGLYIFKVPIVYGYTTLKLKFYGPMGEERTEERILNVPYTIMPAREFEYSLTAGILEDGMSSRFGKADFNYGLNRFITLGGGLEYLSTITTGPTIPSARLTIQPFSKLLITAEYDKNVKTGGILNYSFIKNAYFEIDYNKYVDGQRAIPFKPLEERTGKISLPVNLKKVNGNINFDFTQFVYKGFRFNQGNAIFSVYYKLFSINTSTHINWIDAQFPYLFTDLALSYRLQSGYNLRLSSQYNILEGRLITSKIELEKRIQKGYLSATYERNFSFQTNSVTFSFKYDLAFARTNLSSSYSNGKFTTSQVAQGSLAFAGGDNYIHTSNNVSVGKGGLSLYPFLDLNNNGIFDPGEKMVKISSVKIMGGNVIFRKSDSSLRIPDLIPFTSYIVEFSDNDLDNIAWRFSKKRYAVLIDPNQYKRIDIPVISVGEVSGMVNLRKESKVNGIGRARVRFYKKNSMAVIAETFSESDGYVYYIGLPPGEYVARVDEDQLRNLGWKSDPPMREFTIKVSVDGDIVSGIDFTLSGE